MGHAPDSIKRLVDKFEQHIDEVRSPDYNETLIRIDFINPLMAELGWDMDNRQGLVGNLREVVHEDHVKVGGQTKLPDYGFYVGGKRKFFLEAKKPAVNIKSSWEPAFQIRSYGWSAELDCSLLTDFEEFAVYDTRIEPKSMEKPSIARREFIPYTDYINRWDFLAGTFSKSAVQSGAYDRYCSSKKIRGSRPFDEAFLAEIEEWRKSIAVSLARNNDALDERSLNFAVQRIVDRIIFLRIAEDRGTEPVGQLQSLVNGEKIYTRLCKLFRDADDRYNSGLFHFTKEKDRNEAPDTLTPSLDVDDRTLKKIIEALYFPKSAYRFSVVPADILGSVYERFLGKVITLTAGHSAKIEEKPEVRKAGGVYYTPTYIVDYIVKNTVGKLLNGKTPKIIGTLRVLDPACGSGSFLIGAYQFLLDWYLQHYLADDPAALSTGRKRVLRPTPTGSYALTSAERKRILLDHIHGVDLDHQAVEVTKLNLLLKCLEGETSQTLGFQQRMFHERALPDLGRNILCGNSLIGTDIMSTKAWRAMSDEEKARINPFDYDRAFPHIFKGKDGGFDAVIGNPPYLSYSGRQAVELIPAERAYLDQKYGQAGWPTSHGLFVEKSVRALSADYTSFIIPDQVGHLGNYAAVRAAVVSASRLVEVKYWGEDVFTGVVTPALTFISSRRYGGSPVIVARTGVAQPIDGGADARWVGTSIGATVIAKARRVGSSLGNLVADPGVHTGNCSKELIRDEIEIPKEPLVLEGKQVDRYRCDRPVKRLNTSYVPVKGGYFTIRPIEKYKKAKYVIRQTAPTVIVGPRLHADYFRNSLLALYEPERPVKVEGIVAILNSKLIDFIYRMTVVEAGQKAFPQVKVGALRELPVWLPRPSDERDMAIHNVLAALVDTMLSLHKKLAAETLPQRREQIQREIDATDRQIDQLVYQLYGLTDDEIRIVEQATG